MAKFVRCIEGHVYDSDVDEACPVCGAIPGVEGSGRVPDDPLEDKQSTSGTKDKAQTRVSKTGSKDARKGTLFGVSRIWLVAGVALLLLVPVTIFGLSQGDTPTSIVQNEATEAGPPTAPETSDEGTTQEDKDEGTTDDGSADAAQLSDEAVKLEDSDAESEADTPKDTGNQAQLVAEGTSSNGSSDESKSEQGTELTKLRERALKHLQNKDYDSAIADYTDIIRQGNANWEDYNKRGMSYHYKKDLDLALADYDRAVKSPDHTAFPHYNRSLILRERGDDDGALAELDGAINDHGSKIPSHYIERADIYVLKSRFDDAIADNDKAIDLTSKDKSASRGDKAFTYFMRGSNKKKKVLADREITKDTKLCKNLSAENAGEMGECRYETALLVPLLDFEAAAAIYPNYAQAHAEIGWIASELGNDQRAVEASTKAIQIRPTYSTAYTNRCLAYNNLKEHDLAMADCNDAIRHDPTSARAWTLRGYVYSTRRGRSNRNKAISDLRHALKITPGYGQALTVLKWMGVKP
ncbi:MAG: tetratricopeptide repeat protein [Pseudomonadota bacterium]